MKDFDSRDFEIDLECTLGPSLMSSFDSSLDYFSGVYDDDDNPISEHEIQTLLELGVETITKDMDFQASFQGLKRRLQIHQQKLVKALRRLNERGLIEKNSEGYRLTPSGTKLALQFLRIPLEKKQQTANCDTPSSNSPTHEVFYSATRLTEEDNNLTPDAFLEKLKGRWFGKYRFVGQAINETRAVVEFTSEDGYIHACSCLNRKGILRLGVFKSDKANEYDFDEIRRDGKALSMFLIRALGLQSTKLEALEQPCFTEIAPTRKEDSLMQLDVGLQTKNPKPDSGFHYS